MKLRYFYRIDPNKKQPVPGSNVRRKSKPGRFWKEILLPCCATTNINCTCDARYFVQIDGLNRPVDGTLIKRFTWPKMDEGIRYVEIDWRNPCCCNTDEISSAPQTVASDGGGETVYVSFNLPCVAGGITLAASTIVVGTAMERAEILAADLNSQIVPPLTGTFVVNPDTSISYIGCGACPDSGFVISGTSG